MQLNETPELNDLLIFLTIGENMGTHEKKNLEILQKVARFYFFQSKLNKPFFNWEELTGYFDIALL